MATRISLYTVKSKILTTSHSRTCTYMWLCASALMLMTSFSLRSNKVLEVVKSVVQGQDTVRGVITREMKTERVEALREAKEELASGME